jgi:hypothetical protein
MTLSRLGRFLIFSVAALFLVSWLSADVEKGQVIARAVSTQDDNSVLGLILIKSEDMIRVDSDPFVTIMNSLDRNIAIDFDGTSHYEVSVGDNKEIKRTFPAGKYKIMISAPGLKFVPDRNKVSLKRNREYSLILKRIPTGLEYK